MNFGIGARRFKPPAALSAGAGAVPA
jgi:hypothetical protein